MKYSTVPYCVRLLSLPFRWSTEALRTQLNAGAQGADLALDLSLSNVKPLSVRWILDAHAQLVTLKPSIIKAFGNVGVLLRVVSHPCQ